MKRVFACFWFDWDYLELNLKTNLAYLTNDTRRQLSAHIISSYLAKLVLRICLIVRIFRVVTQLCYRGTGQSINFKPRCSSRSKIIMYSMFLTRAWNWGADRGFYYLITKSVFVICEQQRPESGTSSVLPIICIKCTRRTAIILKSYGRKKICSY